MATIPTQTHPLLSVPFNAATDFTILADHCENFADTLIESDDPALRLALCGRLAACLALLRPTLNDPIRHWPKGERLIAEELGVAPEHIWPSRYRKPEYC